MRLDYRYAGRSTVAETAAGTTIGLATNLGREATYFRGAVGRTLVLREGLATLSDVVRSDFKYRPRDREAFRAYLARREATFLAGLGARSESARGELGRLTARLAELDRDRALRRAPFERARRAYVSFAVHDAVERDLLIDPVISVHPDRLCFEAFSRDQSAYAFLSLGYEAFSRIEEFECGTTNVDFSPTMRTHVERLRSTRATSLVIGASGITSVSGLAASSAPSPFGSASPSILDERKIDLPDGWFSGFLNVHGLLSMGLTRVRLDPSELYDLVRILDARKARSSPRALRFELVPGEPVRIVLEPWERVLTCRRVYEGEKPATIRVWGRDRLRTLARAIPWSRDVEVLLAGDGLPFVVRLDLDGEGSLTLALSGWTDNDWVSGDARFDLLTRRVSVDAPSLTKVHDALRSVRVATDDALATELELPRERVRSALSILCQAGRAMVDAGTFRHRYRDLFFEPFDVKRALALATELETQSSAAAAVGKAIHAADEVRIIAHRPVASGYKVSGNAWSDEGVRVRPQIHVDHEGAIVEASCTCAKGKKHGLTHGPCAHVLSLRLAHMKRIERTSDA